MTLLLGAESRICAAVQNTYRSLIDFLKACYQCAERGGFPPDDCALQNYLLGFLMVELLFPKSDKVWQQQAFVYFGEHAFPLGCRWLIAQIDFFQADQGGVYESYLALGHIPEMYIIMLGTPSGFYL